MIDPKPYEPRRPKPHRISERDPAWKVQEQRIAKRTGGKLQPGSGCTEGAKGDVRADNYELLIEAKATGKKSMSIKRDWLIKIWGEAGRIGKTPCLSITFDSINEKQIDPDWACVPMGWLLDLIAKAKSNAG